MSASTSPKVSSVIKQLIVANPKMTNRDIWEIVQPKFKLSESKRGYPAWYRADMRKKSATAADSDFTRPRIWIDGRKAIPVGRVGRSWVKVELQPDGEIAHTRVGHWLDLRFGRKRLRTFEHKTLRGEIVGVTELAGTFEIEVNGEVVWSSQKRHTTR